MWWGVVGLKSTKTRDKLSIVMLRGPISLRFPKSEEMCNINPTYKR